ncbi:sigma-70 family RNA polymerase sigma factor [Miltoncostaea oceani]|uniref:sigma-70 family RNA polymerase sigma factor n=1 Tax=Miltoncostaea oceani TaxID=2843216 RepID=UPI001C3DBB3A|nr:sigma-70 family RNA polymerase sigma factor [Miltoncostaea oceani]
MSTADLTDAQLGAEALRGDRDAFTALFGRHESGLYNVAYRLTGSREDARDITQEAFLRVFARLDDLRGRDVNLAAYLHRTARNLVYDRSEGRRRETPSAEIETVAGADTALAADPQLSALVGAQGDDVRAASARLPERHRLALALRELEGMGYEDIGRVLDITPGAVAQLLARARMGLRRELRLEQVDVGSMEPGCRARLGDIAALVDGELDPDRAHVLTQHLELCPSCRAAREAFEDAGRRYRAWLPLPLLLGMGADAARAAEGRGLVRFAGGTRRGGGCRAAARRRAARAHGSRGRRRRGAGGGVLVAVPIVVATRSGSTPPAPAAAPVAAAGTTTGSPPSPPLPRRRPPRRRARPPRPPGHHRGRRPRAGRRRPAGAGPRGPCRRPPRRRPPVPPRRAAGHDDVPATAPPAPRPGPDGGAAGDPVPPPAAPAPAPAPPAADPPPVTDPPPGTTTSRDPVEPPPPTTTRQTPPDIPFPTTFTIPRPPIVIG